VRNLNTSFDGSLKSWDLKPSLNPYRLTFGASAISKKVQKDIDLKQAAYNKLKQDRIGKEAAFNSAGQDLTNKTNIKIVNTSKSTLLAYADALRKIDNKYPDSSFANLGAVISKSLSGDPDDPQAGEALADNLSPYISLYDSVIKDLLAISVPDTFVNEHINLVNSTEGVRFSLFQLTKLDTDPTRALLGAQLFPEYAGAIEQTYGAIVNKLAIEDILL